MVLQIQSHGYCPEEVDEDWGVDRFGDPKDNTVSHT